MSTIYIIHVTNNAFMHIVRVQYCQMCTVEFNWVCQMCTVEFNWVCQIQIRRLLLTVVWSWI